MTYLTFKNPDNLRVLFFMYTDLRPGEPEQFYYAGELFDADPHNQLHAFEHLPKGKLPDGTYVDRCIIETHDLNSLEGLFLVTLYITSFPISVAFNTQLQMSLAGSVHQDIKDNAITLKPRQPKRRAVFTSN